MGIQYVDIEWTHNTKNREHIVKLYVQSVGGNHTFQSISMHTDTPQRNKVITRLFVLAEFQTLLVNPENPRGREPLGVSFKTLSPHETLRE